MAGVSTSLALQDRVTNTLLRQVAAADKLINRMARLDSITNQFGGTGAYQSAAAAVNNVANAFDNAAAAQQSAAASASAAGNITNAWSGTEAAAVSATKQIDAAARSAQRATGAVNGTRSGVQAVETAVSKVTQRQSVLQRTAYGITSGWDRIRTGVSNAATRVTEFANRTRKAQEEANKTKGSWDKIVSAVKMAAGAAVTKKAIEFTFGGALGLDSMERELQARIGDADVGSAMFAKLQQQAQKSAFGMEDLTKNTLSFLSATTNPKQLDGLNALAERLAVFDKTGQGLEGAGFSLKEAMSGDIVSLAERFNMSKSQIRAFGIDDMGKKGDVEGFIRQMNALMEAQNMGSEAYNKMLQSPKTQLNMFISNIKTGFATAARNALTALTPLIMKLNEWFSSDQSQQFFSAVGAGLSFIANLVLWVVSGIEWLSGVIQSNWGIIQPILAAIAIVYFAMMIAKLWAMVPPLLAQAAAWLIVNWPILLIIAGIAAMIGILGVLGVSFEDVCGFVGGLLGGMFAFGWNLVSDIWNYIATFAEFFANVFNDPIGSICRLFIGLADFVLGVIQTIADGLDAVFGSSMGDAVAGWRNNMQGWADSKIGKAQIQIQRMDRLDTSTTAAQWSAGGKSFGKSASKALENFSVKGPKGPDTSALNGFKGAGNNGIPNVGKVGEVGKVNDAVDISQEDLELLRDIAEARFVQNFVTLTPSVSMQIDNVNENADVDRLMDEAERRLEEEFVAQAEGVYN